METVDAFSSTTAMAGVLSVVAGIGAICAYGYAKRAPSTGHGWQAFADDAAVRGKTRVADRAENGDEKEGDEGSGDVVPGGKKGRTRRRKRGKGVHGADGEETAGAVRGKPDERRASAVIPGDFDSTRAGPPVDARTASSVTAAGTASVAGRASGNKTRKRTKKSQGRVKGRDDDKEAENKEAENKEAEDEEDEDKEASSEAGRESGNVGGHAAGAYRVRSRGDSTDTSVSLPPSVLSSSLSVAGKGRLRGSITLDVTSPQIQAYPSLSFDTDSSWTHVDRRQLKMSGSMDGRMGTDPTDMTSSDLASTASDSPVAERADNTTDIRGEREGLQRTLAEKLVPKPAKTGVHDMLEKPDLPTLARVMRIQPRAGESPVAGFSWDDYGDVVEDSLLVHDADQEDEGEWGIVKSRSRTRPQQQIVTATPSTSHDAAAAETMTKKQRQNARKRELAKSVKAEAEAARLQGLAKHKRELERLQIIEQSQRGGKTSGGMQALVDDQGKLVWE